MHHGAAAIRTPGGRQRTRVGRAASQGAMGWHCQHRERSKIMAPPPPCCPAERQRQRQRQRSRRRPRAAMGLSAAVLFSCGATDAAPAPMDKELDARREARSVDLHAPASAREQPRPHGRGLRKPQPGRPRSLQGVTGGHPFLPSYGESTCLDDREAQHWERGKATLQECCLEYFGWAREECARKYGELMAAANDTGGKQEEEGDDCGCGKWDWGCHEQCQWRHCGCAAHEWECLEECKAQKAQEELDAEPEAVHPYIPNKKEGTCYNNREAKPWDTPYVSLKQCCGGQFRHIMKECLEKGQLAEHAKETGVYFVANWGLNGCEEMETNGKGKGYLTLDQCCTENFDWVLDECLGRPGEDGGSDFWDTYDPSGVGQSKEEDRWPTEYPETWWHPIWSAGHCTTNHAQAPPAWMSNDPEGAMHRTYKECCETNFPDTWGGELDKCFRESGALAGPTRPPSSQEADGAELENYYWPVYAEARCEIDGSEAPRSFQRDPTTYLTLTAGECCREHFPGEREACIEASPRLPGDEDGSQPVGGSGAEAVNPNRYKYHYFANLRQVACVVNSAMDAPSYMYDAPDAYFFHTVEDCCSVSFEFEYQQCLENTRLHDLDLPLADPYSEYDDGAADQREPSLLIRFQGKLYFRNVFIPHNSPEHLKIIRDVILHAVKGALHRYKVASIAGLNFDGTDVSRLEDSLDSRRGLRINSRRLDRLQLFTFELTLSHPCDDRCAADIARAGRSISLDSTYDFDDAVADNLIFHAIDQDMMAMGLPGPFRSADMPEGYLQYEGVEWDDRYGQAETPDAPGYQEAANPFYPDHKEGTCRNDGLQSEFQSDLFDSLEDCCHFPWLEYYTCIILGEASTNKPEQPTTPWPTREPSPPPSRRPTPKPSAMDFDSGWPTFSPTPQPSEIPTTAPPSESPTVSPTKGPSLPPTTGNASSTLEPTVAGGDSTCGSDGWHVNTETNAGCTNSNKFPDVWLQPELKGRMFHVSPGSCCSMFFPGRACPEVDACGASAPADEPAPGPGPAPTPAYPNCSVHGWHINTATNAGCSNGADNFNELWLASEFKARMFKPTYEECCADFFRTGTPCPKDDQCGGGEQAPAPAPAPEPIPQDPPAPITQAPVTPAPVTPAPVTPVPVTQRPMEPVPVGALESQGFEVADLSETEFTTSATLPWTITDAHASEGTKSVTNSKTGRGESSELKLSLDLSKAVLLSYELRHDVYAPLAALRVTLDDPQNVVALFSGHAGAPKWETREVPVAKGDHELTWSVYTMDIEMPPISRGSGHVWIDNVQTREIMYFDFEDDEFDDAFSFEDFGRWRIDDNMPASNSGLSAHSPKGLLPGEQSTMKLNWNSPEGGTFSFMYHLGMGSFAFLVDDNEEFALDRPGQGTKKFEMDIAAGDHVFSWTYKPPARANMPMSHVWIDEIMAT